VNGPPLGKPAGSRQNSCGGWPVHYIVNVHRVRLADRIAGGPTAHFLFWPAFSAEASSAFSARLRKSAGEFLEFGGVGVLGRHQPYRTSDRANARGDGL